MRNRLPSICLLYWNEAEAVERLERLRAAGFVAYHSTLVKPPLLRQLRENPPSTILIDLARLPSHGQEVGAACIQSHPLHPVGLRWW